MTPIWFHFLVDGKVVKSFEAYSFSVPRVGEIVIPAKIGTPVVVHQVQHHLRTIYGRHQGADATVTGTGPHVFLRDVNPDEEVDVESILGDP